MPPDMKMRDTPSLQSVTKARHKLHEL